MTSSRRSSSTKLSSWTVILIAILVGFSLIVTADAIGNEIFEQRGIKSANGGKIFCQRIGQLVDISNFPQINVLFSLEADTEGLSLTFQTWMKTGNRSLESFLEMIDFFSVLAMENDLYQHLMMILL